MSEAVVTFKDVDIVFGDKPELALPLVDQGVSRVDIQEQTGQILGVAGASFDIREGSVVAAAYPSPVSGYLEPIGRVFDVVLGALSQAIPDRTPAPAFVATKMVLRTRRASPTRAA